jgi:negative regulator of flagellin synthesis FlgM
VQISNEEISRLLTKPTTERTAVKQSATAVAETGVETFADREAVVLSVSPSAQEVQQVKRMINQLPDVREDRVQALKAQIEGGTYRVSGEDIADLIIRRVLADNSAL